MIGSPAPLVTISQIAPSTESLQRINEDPVGDDQLNPDIHVDRKFQRRESILSSRISLFVQQTKLKIPDGGWGWLVVFAAFTINMISDGVGFTFGLLYIEFLHEFGASKSVTSWIGSLFMAIPLIAGPIGSALVDKYGCKSMTIVGGLICTVGFFLSYFANSIGVMYVTFGVIGGLGLMLCYVTAVVSIAFWFEKKRSIALGLAASGTGFGTVVFSPLSNLLIYEYGWRGTLLIMAGLFANMCVCGMLMRDPDWVVEEYERDKLKMENNSNDISKKRLLEKDSLKQGADGEYLLQNIDTSMDLSETNRFKSVIHLPTFLKRNEKVPLEVLKQLEKKKVYNVILENYPNLLTCRSTSYEGINKLASDNDTHSRIPLKFSMKLKETEESKEAGIDAQNNCNNSKVPLLRSTSLNKPSHSYLKNIRFRRNSIGYRGAMLNIHKYKLKASSCPNFLKNSMLTLPEEKEEKWYEEYLDILKDLTHFSLFLELHFLLLALSTIILFVWFIVPYFYLAEHMTRSGYSDAQASFVISIIGFTNTVGMVLLGWAGDRLNVAKTYAVCLIFCGLSAGSILLFTNNYILLIISCGLFGLFFASSLSLTPSLLAQLVPLDEFTMAYGLVLLCQGIGNLTGPPLAGFLFDMTGSWDQSFYQAGFWIIISGVLIGIIPYSENRKILGSSPMLNKPEKEDAVIA